MAEEIDFWQEHSLKFLEMAFRTDRHETIEAADGRGGRTGDCGDTVTFYLTVKDDRIHRVSFMPEGCMHTNACANAAAELVEGKTLTEAWEISPEKVAAFLETLPEDHFHCAELAVGALYLALADCRETRRAAWKKLYR